MFNTSERSTPLHQKEELRITGHGELLDKVNKVEALVADVISSTNGTCESAASAAVDSAVRRARQKNKILPSMGSGLILAALDEVAFDIASLPDVSVTNAAIMRQLTEDMLQKPTTPATPAHDANVRSSSVRSVRGDQVPPNPESVEASAEGGGGAGGGGSEQRSSSRAFDTQSHPSSVLTTIRKPGSGALTTCDMDEEMESTAGTDAATSSAVNAIAHRIMDPLRQLIVETCSEEPHDPECALIRRNLRLKKPKSGDLKMAREINFDECASPRPQTPSSPPSSSSSPRPVLRKLGTPRVRGACLEYGLDATGRNPLKVEPMDHGVDQFNPMTPRGGGTFGSGNERGGTGRILTLKGDHSQRTSSPRQEQHRHQQRQWHSSKGGEAAAVSLGRGTSSPGGGGRGDRVANQGPGMTMCEAGAPPGLLPTARVEGSKESVVGGGEMVGEAAPIWFDPVGDEEGGVDQSGTSMLPAINDMCSQLQSSGI